MRVWFAARLKGVEVRLDPSRQSRQPPPPRGTPPCSTEQTNIRSHKEKMHAIGFNFLRIQIFSGTLAHLKTECQWPIQPTGSEPETKRRSQKERVHVIYSCSSNWFIIFRNVSSPKIWVTTYLPDRNQIRVRLKKKISQNHGKLSHKKI